MKRFSILLLLVLFMFPNKSRADFSDIRDDLTGKGLSFSGGDYRYRSALKKSLDMLRNFDIHVLVETAIIEASKEDIREIGEKANNKIFTTTKDPQAQSSIVDFARELWQIDSAAHGNLVVKIFHEIIQAQKQYIPKKFSKTIIDDNSFVRFMNRISQYVLLKIPRDLLKRNITTPITTTKEIYGTTINLNETIKDFLDFALKVGQRAFFTSTKTANVNTIREIETNVKNYVTQSPLGSSVVG
jgi:hypothetical protein